MDDEIEHFESCTEEDISSLLEEFRIWIEKSKKIPHTIRK